MRQIRISKSITDRGGDSLEKYLSEISKIELLNVEEEVRLASIVREGDRAALDKLVSANLRFVVSVAKNYQDMGLRLADLISEGNLGLIKAASRYDHTKGFKFISFAVWWIRQSITYAIADQHRMIRLPGNQIVGITRLNRTSDLLEQKLERRPSLEEVAEALDLPETKVVDYQMSALKTTSLDMPILLGEPGTTFGHMIRNSEVEAADAVLDRQSLAENVRRLLSILPPREQKILSLYYGLGGMPQTRLEDMVPVFHLSKERLRQLKDKAVKTLKACCSEVPMSGFFN
ncbi:RNA polymerase sigma-70 factor [Pedobacter sp. BAL39]|uniref:sigma-70 family RNA polymerase sigma factor n=1 Tax=Pedobacter sp. BAL39 TaxID=391596 RepID=UPI0001559400|nr:RNA polymerase sigma factor RpoD/SigA [Pedobacter sp. BAL39]EDM36878.1 RNA polymerase sigma-70 factor [Pedobacter sp. BAL39]